MLGEEKEGGVLSGYHWILKNERDRCKGGGQGGHGHLHSTRLVN